MVRPLPLSAVRSELIQGWKQLGAHARIRTGDLFLTKEMLVNYFPIGARLRSNAEAIANNRCLAALPRNRSRRGGAERHEADVGRWLWCGSGQPSGDTAAGPHGPERSFCWS